MVLSISQVGSRLMQHGWQYLFFCLAVMVCALVLPQQVHASVHPTLEGYVKYSLDGPPIPGVWFQWRDNRHTIEGDPNCVEQWVEKKVICGTGMCTTLSWKRCEDITKNPEKRYMQSTGTGFFQFLQWHEDATWNTVKSCLSTEIDHDNNPSTSVIDQCTTSDWINFSTAVNHHTIKPIMPMGLDCVKLQASGDLSACNGGISYDATTKSDVCTINLTNDMETVTLPTWTCKQNTIERSCSISVDSKVYEQTGDASRNVVITTTAIANAETAARTILKRKDGGQIVPAPGNSVESYFGAWYYSFPSNLCNIGVGGGSCEVETLVNLATDLSSDADEYTVHCDMPTPAEGMCSGNPFCDHEGGANACDGWISCSDNDNDIFTISAPSQCQGFNTYNSTSTDPLDPVTATAGFDEVITVKQANIDDVGKVDRQQICWSAQGLASTDYLHNGSVFACVDTCGTTAASLYFTDMVWTKELVDEDGNPGLNQILVSLNTFGLSRACTGDNASLSSQGNVSGTLSGFIRALPTQALIEQAQQYGLFFIQKVWNNRDEGYQWCTTSPFAGTEKGTVWNRADAHIIGTECGFTQHNPTETDAYRTCTRRVQGMCRPDFDGAPAAACEITEDANHNPAFAGVTLSLPPFMPSISGPANQPPEVEFIPDPDSFYGPATVKYYLDFRDVDGPDPALAAKKAAVDIIFGTPPDNKSLYLIGSVEVDNLSLLAGQNQHLADFTWGLTDQIQDTRAGVNTNSLQLTVAFANDPTIIGLWSGPMPLKVVAVIDQPSVGTCHELSASVTIPTSLSECRCTFNPVTAATENAIVANRLTDVDLSGRAINEGELEDIVLKWSQPPGDMTDAFTITLSRVDANSSPLQLIRSKAEVSTIVPGQYQVTIRGTDLQTLISPLSSGTSYFAFTVQPTGSICWGGSAGVPVTQDIEGKARLRVAVREVVGAGLNQSCSQFSTLNSPNSLDNTAVPAASLSVPSGYLTVTGPTDMIIFGSVSSGSPYTRNYPLTSGGNWRVESTPPAGLTADVPLKNVNTLGVTLASDGAYSCYSNCNGSGKICQKTPNSIDPTRYQVLLVSNWFSQVGNWWQTVGGPALAGGTIATRLPLETVGSSTQPLLCKLVADPTQSRPECAPYLSRSPSWQVDKTAGIPLAASFGSMTNEALGWTSEKLAPTTRAVGVGTTSFTSGVLSSVAYDTLLNQVGGVSKTTPVTSWAQITAAVGAGATAIPDDAFLFHIDSAHASVNPFDFNTPLIVGADRKVIIFVDGSATISQSISVVKGGFFAVIASGNITVTENVGTDLAGLLTSQALGTGNATAGQPGAATPNLEGVYIAGGTLTIEGNGSTSTTGPANKRFVGAGTFVGHGGVLLNRSLIDSSNPDTYTQAAYSPAEIFIYRPDFLMNMPDMLKQSDARYSEQ